MKRARVILADDHTMFVEGLEKLLEPEFKVVGSFPDGLSLVKAARELDYEHMKEQPQLSLCQRQVLQLLAEGHSLKEIAFKLDLCRLTAPAAGQR